MWGDMMSNPNNNMNAYKQALQINRDLKKENDSLKSLIEEVDNFLLTLNVTNSVEDREVGRLQELIRSICGDWELVSQSLPKSEINPKTRR